MLISSALTLCVSPPTDITSTPDFAAASILAKTYRDDYMNELAARFPAYHWQENKGYPTKAHREAIRQCGITPYHRKTFTLLPRQLSLFEE